MSDIIDSLKRLERIGSESSKTVEKIIEAARDLVSTIIAQYPFSDGARIQGASCMLKIAKGRGCSAIEAATSLGLDYSRIQRMQYEIKWREGVGRGLFIQGGGRVSANRESALAFARDLASGLLVLIEADLLARQAEERQALDTLRAVSLLPKKKLPDEL